MSRKFALCLLAGLLPASALAAEATVDMHAISASGVGARIGTVTLSDTAGGLQIRPDLAGLPVGDRGFHVHETGNCGAAMSDGKMAAGMAAGGHYDPGGHKAHRGPTGQGHMGDLPALKVGPDGQARDTMTVKRLSVGDIAGRALMIHGGGDNYADTPAPLGGGGARIACGIIPR